MSRYASRVRSREAETEIVNVRMQGRQSITRSAIQPREVGALEQLPGLPRAIRPQDLATDTIVELDARFTGRTLTLARTTTQTITHNSGAGAEVSFTAMVGESRSMGDQTFPLVAPSLPVTAVWGMTVGMRLGAVPAGTELVIVDADGVRLWPLGTTWVAERDHASPTFVTISVPHRPWDAELAPAVRVIPPSGETVDVAYAEATWGIEGPSVGEALDPWVKVTDEAIWGLIRLGDDWWATEGNSGLTVTRYDAAWESQQTFEASVFTDDRVRGITSDGTDLWLAGPLSTADVAAIVLYSTAGTALDSFNPNINSPTGLAFDGTNLWVLINGPIGSPTYRLRRYSTAGTLLDDFVLADDIDGGLAWHDGNLYAVHTNDQRIVRLDTTDGSVLETISLDDVPALVSGLWIEPDGTVYVSTAFGSPENGVWRRRATL